MKKSDVTVGMLVTCKEEVEAMYSNYGAHKGTVITFQPGDLGVVTHIDVPNVTGPDTSHVLVAFYTGLADYSPSHVPESPWTVALEYMNLVARKDFIVGYMNWLDTLCLHCATHLQKQRGHDFELTIEASKPLLFTDGFKDCGYTCDYCSQVFPEVNMHRFRDPQAV